MKIELFDWRTDGFRYGSTEEYAELTEGQKKPWEAELKIDNTEIRIEATAPNGSKGHVWVELDQGVLKIHCYDNVHDEPACTVFLDEEQSFVRRHHNIVEESARTWIAMQVIILFELAPKPSTS